MNHHPLSRFGHVFRILALPIFFPLPWLSHNQMISSHFFEWTKTIESNRIGYTFESRISYEWANNCANLWKENKINVRLWSFVSFVSKYYWHECMMIFELMSWWYWDGKKQIAWFWTLVIHSKYYLNDEENKCSF